MSNLFSSPDPDFSALLYAVRANNLKEVSRILAASTDPCALILRKHRNTLDLNMLTYAAYINVNPEILRKMIDVCPAALGDRDPGGSTPLHQALFKKPFQKPYSYGMIRHMLVKDPTYPKVLEKSDKYPMAPTPLDVLRYTPPEYREPISPLLDFSKSGPDILKDRAFDRRIHALYAYAMQRAADRSKEYWRDRLAELAAEKKGSGTRRRSRMSFTRKRRSLNKKK